MVGRDEVSITIPGDDTVQDRNETNLEHWSDSYYSENCTAAPRAVIATTKCSVILYSAHSPVGGHIWQTHLRNPIFENY